MQFLVKMTLPMKTPKRVNIKRTELQSARVAQPNKTKYCPDQTLWSASVSLIAQFLIVEIIFHC